MLLTITSASIFEADASGADVFKGIRSAYFWSKCCVKARSTYGVDFNQVDRIFDGAISSYLKSIRNLGVPVESAVVDLLTLMLHIVSDVNGTDPDFDPDLFNLWRWEVIIQGLVAQGLVSVAGLEAFRVGMTRTAELATPHFEDDELMGRFWPDLI